MMKNSGGKSGEQSLRALWLRLVSTPRANASSHSTQLADLSTVFVPALASAMSRLGDSKAREQALSLCGHILRLLVPLLNGHLSLLWAVKDRPAKLQTVAALFSLIQSIESLFAPFLPALAPPLTHLRALSGRAQRCVACFVYQALAQELDRHFTVYRGEFVLLAQSRETGGLCCRAPSLPAKADDAVHTLLRSLGLDPLASAAPIPQLVGAVLNASLCALLDALLCGQVPVDEEGAYKLYRILVQLLEHAAALKQRLGMGRLLEDEGPWRRAEKALQLLSQGFSTPPHLNNTLTINNSNNANNNNNSNNSNNSNSSNSSNSNYSDSPIAPLSLEEAQQWRKLVYRPRGLLSSWYRQRQKQGGKVFLVLSLDTAQL